MEEDYSKFPAFPFKPYSIQIDFMNALYRSLNNGGVSMLESPTGTGKTLSIICSAMQWLLDQRQQQKSEKGVESNKNRTSGSEDEPDWLKNFVVDKDNEGQDKKNKRGFALEKPDKRNRENYRNSLLPEDEGFYKNKECETSQKKNNVMEMNDEEFLVEEYESEDEGGVNSRKSKRKACGVSISSSSDEEEEEDGFEEKLKVYFCSRTHSQLSQFVKELRKTVFASEMVVVCLGSRKNFCINEEVLKLGSTTRINEQCLELQKKKKNDVSKIKNLSAGGRTHRTKAASGCPMLKKRNLQKQFRKEISEQGALDIEDLVHLGSRIGTCPYYGSRSMVEAADLVVLPYQSLLSKSSRESLGLNLKNNVIIIDEAHNLADSLISMYDSKITFLQLEHVHSHIERYLERFRNLLGPGNRRYIQTLMVLTQALIQSLLQENGSSYLNPSQETERVSGAKSSLDFSMSINDFLFSLNIDNINLIKLLTYVNESNIIHKVSGYGDKVASLQKIGEFSEEESTLSGFRALVGILQSLTYTNGDGRIIISKRVSACSGGYLKYVMLTGEKIFSEVVDQAHAVIMAGGTLQPIEETRERLFPRLPLDQLHFFSCSHIVPPESILPIAVSHGPTDHPFDFSFNSRSTPPMIQQLGFLLSNLASVVPEGIVVFFSSFDYEEQVYDSWKKSGILDRIAKKKHVFREPRKSTDVELLLKKYKETIDHTFDPKEVSKIYNHGAILLAVVGGKISEGINFSDGMGRCIVMVGLPYPSPSDIELIERVKHIEGLGDSSSLRTPYNGDVQAGFDVLRSCKRRGKEYYENLCMKAVNQSIGRAIRHVNDYAAILLVDTRYTIDSSKPSFSSHPINKLPKWIKDRLISSNDYGEVHHLLHQFFKSNKERRCKQ